MEQVRRNSSSVIVKAVINRLTFLRERSNQNNNSLNERWIGKQTRQLQETLGYLNYYLTQTNDEATTAAQPLFLDVFQAGLETLVAILQSSQHFRHVLLQQDTWNMLVELLRRHNVRLRMLVCQVMTLCLDVSPALGRFSQSTAYDAIIDLMTNDDTWSVLFGQPHVDWDLGATRMTNGLVQVLRATFQRFPTMTREPRVLQRVQSLGALLNLYNQHAQMLGEPIDPIPALMRQLEERFAAEVAADMVARQNAMVADVQRLSRQLAALRRQR